MKPARKKGRVNKDFNKSFSEKSIQNQKFFSSSQDFELQYSEAEVQKEISKCESLRENYRNTREIERDYYND